MCWGNGYNASMGAVLPPLLLRPHYVRKPWGGRRLAEDLGRRDLPDGPVGESWEVYDLPRDDGTRTGSVVDGGPHDGQTLHDVLGHDVPLLLKVIDAREDLSVQLHPGGEAGKEEAWIALGAGARVAVARAGTVLAPAGAAAMADGAWLDALDCIDLDGGCARTPRAPAITHIPPGTVHAILGGSLLFEVQNPSDVTWRIDDHGRVGLDGAPRTLHRDEAAPLLAEPTPAPAGVVDGRLDGERFVIELLAPGEAAAPVADAVFFADGGAVHHGEGETLAVPRGRTVWLPSPVRALASDGWMVAARARVR